MLCWGGSVVSLSWFYASGNYHGWAAALIVPWFTGFVAGAVLLSKFRDKRLNS